MIQTHPKVATICLSATADTVENVEKAFTQLKEAVAQGANWILLPEIFNYHGPYSDIYQAGDEPEGDLFHRLADFAAAHKVVLFAGTIGVRPHDLEESAMTNDHGQRRVYNRLYVFDQDGSLIEHYDKTHLFNLRDDQGQAIYCESDGFIAGSSLKRIVVEGFHVGLATCYDLRFSGVFQKLTQNEALDVLVIPAAFTKQTGEAHWELLLRARAVEFQCYVIAANQTGEHRPGKESYGHSMIVDPWGEVLCNTGADVGLVCTTLSPEKLREVRQRLPMRQNQRPELYP